MLLMISPLVQAILLLHRFGFPVSHSSSPPTPVPVHFFALPKTASSTAREVLKQPCFKDFVHPVQHRFCNGSSPRWQADDVITVATIREPCDRFHSMVHHLHLQDSNGIHGSGNATELLEFVSAASGRCTKASNHDDCLVREMSADELTRRQTTHERIQIPLFPQSWMVSPRTHLVCYDESHFQSRFVTELYDLTGCRRGNATGSGIKEIRRNDHPYVLEGNGNGKNDEICVAVRRLYPRDVDLWEHHCAG